jgi:hypothetical protein
LYRKRILNGRRPIERFIGPKLQRFIEVQKEAKIFGPVGPKCYHTKPFKF